MISPCDTHTRLTLGGRAGSYRGSIFAGLCPSALDHADVTGRLAVWPFRSFRRETYIPAVQTRPRPASRFPRPHGDQGRPSGHRAPPCTWPQAALGLSGSDSIPVKYPDRAARLRVRRDFLRARDAGRSAARPGLVVQAVPRDPAEGPARAGFTASKKVGNAVQRNRARRRLKEAARLILPLHGAPGTDYVFIARAHTAARPWTALLDDMKSALLSLAAPTGPRKTVKDVPDHG